jgi:hypothetical protein
MHKEAKLSTIPKLKTLVGRFINAPLQQYLYYSYQLLRWPVGKSSSAAAQITILNVANALVNLDAILVANPVAKTVEQFLLPCNKFETNFSYHGVIAM